MSVIRPKFLQVQTADLRHGYDGACLLALVRYVTDREDEHNGRVRLNGEIWWHTSQRDIAESLDGHVSHDSVRRTLKNLESVGALESRYVSADDHSKAYTVRESSDQRRRGNASTVSSDDAKSPHPDADSPRINGAAHHFQTSSDLSLRGNASTVSSDDAKSPHLDAKSPHPDADSPHPRREIASCSSPVEELKKNLEKGEKGVQVSQARDTSNQHGAPSPEPDLFCEDHMPDGPGKVKCGPCGDARRKHTRWEKAKAERVMSRAFQAFDKNRNGTPSDKPIKHHPDAPRIYRSVVNYSIKNGPQSRAFMKRAVASEDRPAFEESWPDWVRAGLVIDVGNGQWTTSGWE